MKLKSFRHFVGLAGGFLILLLFLSFKLPHGIEKEHRDSLNPIGIVVKLKGTVVRSNERRNLNTYLVPGYDIFSGDKITCGEKGQIKILMKDDTVLQLGPHSQFIFEDFNLKSKRERTATYYLVQGKMRGLFTMRPTIKKGLAIKTPNTLMDVQDSEILSDVYFYGGDIKTDIALLSGKLGVKIKGSWPQIFQGIQGEEAMGNGIGIMGGRSGHNHNREFQLKSGHLLQLIEDSHEHPSLTRLSEKTMSRLKNYYKKRGGSIFLYDARHYRKKRDERVHYFVNILKNMKEKPSMMMDDDADVEIEFRGPAGRKRE